MESQRSDRRAEVRERTAGIRAPTGFFCLGTRAGGRAASSMSLPRQYRASHAPAPARTRPH
jgi:hypothetical protein